MIPKHISLIVGMACLPAVLAAQGSLSGQGFGYPPGQLSARAAAMGGGIGELDPASPINPAALGGWASPALFVQYGPEFRQVKVGSRSDRTTTLRFPLFGVAVPVSARAVIGVSASTLLDRTYSTRSTVVQTVRGQPVTSVQTFNSTGAINDIRVAGAWALRPSLHIGVAAHALTGENRLFTGLSDFSDTTFRTFSESSSLDYSGIAFSAGAEWRPLATVGVGASVRKGGTIRASKSDTLVDKATVPDRAGASVRYTGVRGSTLAVGANWTGWSSLEPLGSTRFSSFDGWDVGAGADVEGPRFGERAIMVRGGLQWRALPFGLGGKQVHELAFSAGTGIPLAGGRAMVDFSAQRGARSSDFVATETPVSGVTPSLGKVSERAWTFNIGLVVRP